MCDVVSERDLEAMLAGATGSAIYVLPDNGDVPEYLHARDKYLFNDGELCPWPAQSPVGESISKGPAAWTQYFLLGSQSLACQLENIRTILKARGSRGVPQYVLITGETGTGKSFIAKSLAKICGDEYDDPNAKFREEADVRNGRDFLYGNCASLSPALADALLFGAVRGAYTGCDRDVDGLIESAGKGILFLDEVGDLPLETQGKLLTALEEKSYYRLGDTGKKRDLRNVDCNIIFGTNRDLEADAQVWESSHGRTGFRKDLLYRINSCHIELPPLRTRLSDANQTLRDAVLDGIVKRNCEGVGLALTDGARREFDSFACRYAWPGNFRDVKHLFENLNVAALGDGAGSVVSAYAMMKAVSRLEAATTSNGDADGNEMPLVDKVKAEFQSPCEANDIDFVFEVCRGARSCADAGRAYYGTAQKRNFADAFGKRLAHYGLVFDREAAGHLAAKRVAADGLAK
ncbi:MAG: sigma 54-interacting transcriptional regulator [Kiritimatiellae bacterium]|nr:sigma 54-interacting transcriptional regulator [Kiritimatiellia bacterium]